MGWLERWDERNQRQAEKDNVLASNENWQRSIDETPGPDWAYALGAVPVLWVIGEIAIWVAERRQRRSV